VKNSGKGREIKRKSRNRVFTAKTRDSETAFSTDLPVLANAIMQFHK